MHALYCYKKVLSHIKKLRIEENPGPRKGNRLHSLD